MNRLLSIIVSVWRALRQLSTLRYGGLPTEIRPRYICAQLN